MSDSATFTRIALRLPGAISAPHFDRVAFKVKRTFATLPADGLSANIKFTPDEQELKCMVAPEVFTRIDNGGGTAGLDDDAAERCRRGRHRGRAGHGACACGGQEVVFGPWLWARLLVRLHGLAQFVSSSPMAVETPSSSVAARHLLPEGEKNKASISAPCGTR